jgi:hypothetical protein
MKRISLCVDYLEAFLVPVLVTAQEWKASVPSEPATKASPGGDATVDGFMYRRTSGLSLESGSG